MSKFLFQSELIRAGAGTGKTYQLIEKIYGLFEQTLTAKKRVPRLIVCTFTKKAAQELKERLFEKSLESLDTSLPLTNSFLDYISSSALQVGTIDSILYQLLKKHGHMIELNPDFEIALNSLNDTLFDSFSKEFLYKKHFSLLKKLPYPYLKELLLSYYKYRIQYGRLSFYDEKDFKEFQEEKDFFKDRKEIFPNDFTEDFTEDFKRKSQVYQLYLKFKGSDAEKDFDYSAVKKLFREEEIFKSQNFIPLFHEFQIIAEEFFSEFLKIKKNSPSFSIEDLLLFTCHLLNTQPEVPQKINQEWDYWLIDEYQDTSFLQDQVLEKITGFKNIFCVGDPGQSIYTFRGADSEVFKNREKKLIKIGGALRELKLNRRSSPALISFYNDFFPEESFTKFEQNDQSEYDPSCLSFFTYHLEEKKIILPALLKYIRQLKREQKASYGDMAVLCSKNEDIIEVSNYLKEEGIPLMIYGSKTISQNRVVLDSLFLLKFLINPYDDDNLKALLRTPYFRLSDQDLVNSSYEYKELDFSNKLSFWFFLKEKYKEKSFVENLSTHLENYRSLGLFESFKQALFNSGMMDLADYQDPAGTSSASLWKLLSLLKESKKSALNLFYELTEKDLDNSNNFNEPPAQHSSECMELMTIHKSKGLQFKHVIVLDFSMIKAPVASRNIQGDSIYDTSRNKMSFSVPLGARDKKKIKTYGHKNVQSF